MKHFDKEDYKALPLASLGLAKGVANIYVKPALQDTMLYIGRVIGRKLGLDMPVDFEALEAIIAEGATTHARNV